MDAELKLLRIKLRLHAFRGLDRELRLPVRLIEPMHIEHELAGPAEVLHRDRPEKGVGAGSANRLERRTSYAGYGE